MNSRLNKDMKEKDIKRVFSWKDLKNEIGKN